MTKEEPMEEKKTECKCKENSRSMCKSCASMSTPQEPIKYVSGDYNCGVEGCCPQEPIEEPYNLNKTEWKKDAGNKSWGVNAKIAN